MPLKIAMIGAGSIGFTRRLMGDLLTVPEFAETTFAFTDLNAHNLDMSNSWPNVTLPVTICLPKSLLPLTAAPPLLMQTMSSV